MRKAIFLDRDGVINAKVINLVSPEQFVLADGRVARAIKKINNSRYMAIVVTNQPIIAKGFCTFEDMEAIHKKMRDLLAEQGARIDAVYVCPHHPEKGFENEVTALKIDCDCRKPRPGLLLKAAQDYKIDLSESWMIGDNESDIEAGRNAGVRTVLLAAEGSIKIKPDLIKRDLLAAVDAVLAEYDG